MTKFQFIVHYLRLNQKSYLLATLFIFAVNWLQVEIPHYIQLAIDLVDDVSSSGHGQLKQYVWIVIVMSILMIVTRIFSRVYALNPGRITEAVLKNDLLAKLNALPNNFHQRFTSGKLISILNNDLTGIRLLFGVGFLQVVNILFALSLTPLWMWRISPELTLYSVIPITIAFIIFRLGFVRMKALHIEHLQRLQNLSSQLMNYLSGIDVIKNQQMSPWVEEEINKLNQLLLRCRMRITKIQTFIMPVLDYANNLMKILILGLGGYMLLNQELTLGEITAFLSYSVLLAFPLMQLGRVASLYQRGMVGIDSVQVILNESLPEKHDVQLSEQEVSQLRKQTLKVQNLTFYYPGDDNPILDNISFALPAGKKLGLLGAIGSGKSTLVNCLNHHLDIPSNSVFLGDRDITSFSRQDIRRFIRTITQDPYLFSDSIENNVLFGSAESTSAKQKVPEILALSQLADDVARFEQQEHTLVGEKGIMLSGGQKQRLSIARALLESSDIIIMDNVLSAVDYETERKILQNLFAQLTHQSMLVVSHRVSALEYMDEIMVLDQGKIIASGDHQTLLETCSYYRNTWQLQQNETEAQAC
ncbi:ABC transporter ATP-binding protein [Vibrio hippocampi]|uniref:Multidrug resistance ABC transporter ATP-binding/permease protein YheI n=1 Tax=Vibrio hippocampi TaxID=654686 RepID=A0ABM8ZP01_9VIBR|nr:ABC transporter ATP-binding protein [Vibrio hippocampi]CAH0530398.1 putative multidrug resistance ABC transporter ATP-binding/permease protein YheI [Vibrio hippocampi]